MKTIFTFAIALAVLFNGIAFAQDNQETIENPDDLKFGFYYGDPYNGGVYAGNPYNSYNPYTGNPYYGNPYYGNPYYGNPYYGNPYYGGGYYPGYPNGGNGNWGNYPGNNYPGNNYPGANYADNNSFNQFVIALNNEAFDANKLQMATYYATTVSLNVQQIGKILEQFAFDKTKVDFAKAAYNKCYDKQNYVILRDKFAFSSSFAEVLNYIGY